jgi:hypothetical protein
MLSHRTELPPTDPPYAVQYAAYSHGVLLHTRSPSKPQPVARASSLFSSSTEQSRAPGASQKANASAHIRPLWQIPSTGPSLSLHTKGLPYLPPFFQSSSWHDEFDEAQEGRRNERWATMVMKIFERFMVTLRLQSVVVDCDSLQHVLTG